MTQPYQPDTPAGTSPDSAPDALPEASLTRLAPLAQNGQTRPAGDPTRFILIGTSHPGNVGATARAMKVMGFTTQFLSYTDHDDPYKHKMY